MILLEGCDRCGKTTTAMALREILGSWSFRSHTKPVGDVFPYQLQTIADSSTRVILDRCHYSNIVYGQLFGNQPIFTARDWRFLELALQALQCTVIWLDDEDEAITSRWSKDEMYAQDTAVKIAKAYREYFQTQQPHRTALHIIKANLTDMIDLKTSKPTTLLATIAKHEMVKLKRAVDMHLLPPTAGIGNVNPGGFVIIGEAPSPVQYQGYIAARLPWDMGPAAEWLWKALDARHINVHRGYYTNASAYSASHLLRLLSTMSPDVVVALGTKAKQLVQETDELGKLSAISNLVYLRHPMAAKRFDFNGFENYADELAKPLENFITIGG